MENKVLDIIDDADLILIGIGKEFEKSVFQRSKDAMDALNRLAEVLGKKNYFVVSICTNDIALCSDLKNDRIVQPCGTIALKQCINRCEKGLQSLTEEEKSCLTKKLNDSVTCGDWQCIYQEDILGNCPECGERLVLNTVYTESYDENGYLKDWNRYTKWLQGTLNKKLCILELGVDLTYPSIIRWPFEKIAFYNQKAHFVRVNEKLYHMSEELKDKGISIAQNAVQWLLES